MRKVLLVFAAIQAFSFGAALAQDDQGTPEQRRACKDDAYKYCPYDVPDPEKTEACLRRYMRALSPECRAQFEK
ncbi:cysteine rich repeat-containing protein [Methylocystis sp. S23]|jgi:hypothetical protein